MLPARMVSGDRYLICPYDDTHEILAKSFSAHLIKCRKNHGGHKLVTCPLDSTHKIPKPELPYHKSVCDKRSLMDREMQKRAGDNGLRGDVVGPPIVPDHSAGHEEEEESWDDVPQGAFVTPALFNYRPNTTAQETAPSHNPPGGYVPPKKEESIRKVPNAPAKAAILSNPSSAQMRAPAPNQVFNYSLGLTDAGRGSGMNRMPMMSVNRMSNPSLRPGVPMSGVRVPVQDQGPRFIGRGISKYATKSEPTSTASAQQTHKTSDLEEARSQPQQFDDKLTSTDTPPTANDHSLSQQQQNLVMQKLMEEEMIMKAGGDKTVSLDDFSIKQQQLLQTRKLLYQHQSNQMKEQFTQQELKLAKKHELQMLQLQKLQSDEQQQLRAQYERVEHDLRRDYSTSLSILSNSSAVSAEVPPQSFLPPGMLEAIGMGNGAGLSGMMAPGINDLGNSLLSQQQSDNKMTGGETYERQDQSGPQFVDVANGVESVESVGASMSKVSVHDSNANNGPEASNSAEDVIKERKKLTKKLKQIDILEQKRSLGHRLSVEEEMKLNAKAELSSKLEQLNKS